MNRKHLLIFVLILTVCTNKINAQSNLPKQINDSLWTLWNDKSKADTNRLNAINKIAREGYLFTLPDSAFYYAELQLEYAKKKGIGKHIANALNTQGLSFYFKKNYSQALPYYTQCLNIRKKEGDKIGMANSYNNIGILYQEQGNYAKAIEYYTNSLKIRELIADKKGVATSLNNIGVIYKDQQDYNRAIIYFEKSLKLQEELDDKKGIAAAMGNIAIIYKAKKEYSKALEYDKKSLEIRESINDIAGIVNSLNNIGAIYQDLFEYDEAIKYLTKSLKLVEQVDDKQMIAALLNNMANIYFDKKNYSKAIELGKQSLENAKSIGLVYETSEISMTLFKLYRATGDSKNALEMHLLYTQMRDSVSSIEGRKEIIRQEYKYAYEKKLLSDSLTAIANQQKLAQVAAQKEAEMNRIIFIQYLGIALGIIIIFLTFVIIGRTYFSIKFIENSIVLLILLLFEFVLVIVDPLFQGYVTNTPLPILLLNVGLAILFTPIHSFIEYRLKSYMIKKNA